MNTILSFVVRDSFKTNMKLIRKIPAAYYIFAASVILFCGLFTTVELINHKFWTNDFKVYYDAVNDFFSGGNPYIKNYGLDTGFFKYPPFTLYLFSFFTFVPYWLGQFFHLGLLALSFIISIPVLKGFAIKTFGNTTGKKYTWILYAVFLMVAIHLTREFHLGNVNLILLLLFTLGLKTIDCKNTLYTAIFWSLMVVLKPIMILGFIPLIFWRKWKLILWLTGFGLFFLLFPALHLGWNANLMLWANWFSAIAKHGEYIVSENSMTYLANHYFGIASAWIPSLLCLLVLLGVMLFEIYRNGADEKRFVVWTVIFTAFTPNFFVTDTEHFLLSAPLLVFLLYRLTQVKSYAYWILFFVGMLFFSFNSNDLLGRDLSDYLDAQGILGIGNILLICTFITAVSTNPREKALPVAAGDQA